MKATARRIMIAAAMAVMAAASAFGAAQRLTVKVTKTSSDPISGYWVEYTINGMKFRSDRTGEKINAIAWNAMNDADKEKTVKAVYGVGDARRLQFGVKTASEMGDWFDFVKGWKHGKQILVEKLVEKDYPGLYARFNSYNYYWDHFRPKSVDGCPDKPELDALSDLGKYYYDLADSAYRALENAEYMRTAAAVKSTAGDLIKLIVDKCLVPAVAPGINGGIALLSKPDALGTAMDYFGSLTHWQDNLEEKVLGKRANAADAMAVIKLMDSAIAASYKLIKDCTTKAHELQNEVNARYDEWVASTNAHAAAAESDALVLKFRKYTARNENGFPRYFIEEAGVPTQSILDQAKRLKDEEDARLLAYSKIPNDEEHEAAQKAARAAWLAAQKAFEDYGASQQANVMARIKAWQAKFDARLNEFNAAAAKVTPPEYPGKGTTWNDANFYDSVKKFTASEADVAKAIGELTAYADKKEAYHYRIQDLSRESLSINDEMLAEGQPIYNDYLAVNWKWYSFDLYKAIRPISGWMPSLFGNETTLFWRTDPAFMDDVRTARSYIRLCENYSTTMALKKRYEATQEAFRTKITKGVISAKNTFNAAKDAYAAAVSNVPAFVKQEQYKEFASGYSYGYSQAGNMLQTKDTDTELGRAFGSGVGSAALAQSYRDRLNKSVDAYNTALYDREDANLTSYYRDNMAKRFGLGEGRDIYSLRLNVDQTPDQKKQAYLQEDFNGHPYSHRVMVGSYGEIVADQESYVTRYDSPYYTDSKLSAYGDLSRHYSYSDKPQFNKSVANGAADGAGLVKNVHMQETMGEGSYAYYSPNYYEQIIPVKNPHNAFVQPLVDSLTEIRRLLKAGKVDPTWQLKLFKNDGTSVSTNFVCAYGIPRRMPTADDLMWAKPGYRLKGWGVYTNSTVVAYKPESYITNFTARAGKKVYYAMWELANEQHKLFAIPNGGVLSGAVFGAANGQAKTGTLTMTVGKATNATIGKAARAGFKFRGWYDQEEGGRKVFDANGKAVKGGTYWDAKGNWKFEGRVFVYAQFDLDPNAYMIRFHKNDGTGVTRELGYVYGTAKNLPTCANGLGWTSTGLFKGWATSRVNAAKGIVWKTDGATVKTAAAKGKTLNVYAVWEKAYNIRFHKQDGTGSTYTRKYTSGYKSPLPKYSTSLGWARRGFKFKGWATSPSTTKVWKTDGAYVSAATTPGKTLNAYAVWELDPNYYCIYFVRNDGAGTWRKLAYLPGTQYTLPSLSGGLGWARRGYTFKGWATSTANARSGKIWKTDAAKFKDVSTKGKTLTVYAVWQLKSGYYQISFQKNDGSGKWRTLAYQYGKNTKLPTCVNGLGWNRSGYTFRGWATSAANAKAGKIWKADGAYVKTAAAAGKTQNAYAVWAQRKTANAVLPSTNAAKSARKAPIEEAVNAGTAAPSSSTATEGETPLCFAGPLADGTGEYFLQLDGTSSGIFSAETADWLLVAPCEAVRSDGSILLTLDDGSLVVVAPDGTATLL